MEEFFVACMQITKMTTNKLKTTHDDGSGRGNKEIYKKDFGVVGRGTHLLCIVSIFSFGQYQNIFENQIKDTFSMWQGVFLIEFLFIFVTYTLPKTSIYPVHCQNCLFAIKHKLTGQIW